MHTKRNINLSINNLKHLPGFADYLLKHLRQFAENQIKFSRELQIPMLNAFSHWTDDQLIQLSMETNREYLTYLSKNKAEDQLDDAIIKWIKNQLPVIDQKQVATEDITLMTHIRRKNFLHFIFDYCKDQTELIELLNEIDTLLTKAETELTATYTDLLYKRIREQSFLTEKITNTSPGIIYLFNVHTKSISFTNETAEEFFGLKKDEFLSLGDRVIPELLHPNDVQPTLDLVEEIGRTIDQEDWSQEFRLRNSKGEYVWMRNYISVFKKDDAGYPVEIIGNILNIQTEKETAAQLTQSEERYRQAARLSSIGHFILNLRTNDLLFTEELNRIYEFDINKFSHKYEDIIRLRHPEDVNIVRQNLERTIETKQPFNFYYRIITKSGTHRTLHTQGGIVFDENKQPAELVGTVQDVTERHQLLQKLQQNEDMYRQAEKLANMGNYTWDVRDNTIAWTDNLYNIYGLQPQSEQITLHRFQDFVHPDYKEQIEKAIANVNEHKAIDHTFKIITARGETKTLRSIAQVVLDENGNPEYVIGTEQDVTERESLIARLQESEKLHKQAQSIAHLGNWSLDLLTNEVTWSEELFNIYEITGGKPFSSEEWQQYIYPEDRNFVNTSTEKSIREKKSIDITHRIITRSGKIKVVHRRGEFLFNEHGEAVKLVGTTQDVTEEYKIRQELEDNQKFIRKIADATPSIIASYNVHSGQYVFVSEGIEKLLGYNASEVKEKGLDFFVNIVHPDDLPSLVARNNIAMEEANANGGNERNDILEFIYRMRHKNGSYRWFHTYGTVFDRNANGEVEHVLNISLDITEQKEAIKKIKEQEHFIQNIADASPTVLYVYDIATASIVYANKEIYFVLGYTPDEILDMGKEVTSLLYHPEDLHLLPERKESTKRIVESDIMLQYECRIKNREGEWQWFLVREVVFKTDENDRVLQIVGAALDITKRKEMERTLLQNSFQLEQSNASLEEFAYVASHDLKEPLRKISTFGDRLAASQSDKLTPEGKIYLNKIVDASQRMQTMINDLLSISMISGNKSFERYSLQKILEETLQTLEFKIEQKNAIINSTSLPEANIVPSQFRQLFQNLISNSLKFVREDVRPQIDIQHKVLRPDEVHHYQLALADQYIRIEIRDNGIGFENEYAGKIFAIFQRLHGRSEYEGSGIGLAICKKIVEHHGGVIYASGELDKGAVFTIILPL